MLAFPAQDQIEILRPWDVPFELIDDFENGCSPVYLRENRDSFSPEALQALSELETAIEGITDDDWDDADLVGLLNRPCWVKIREKAQALLDVLGIELGDIPKPVRHPDGGTSQPVPEDWVD
jgi:hypothetical protein